MKPVDSPPPPPTSTPRPPPRSTTPHILSLVAAAARTATDAYEAPAFVSSHTGSRHAAKDRKGRKSKRERGGEARKYGWSSTLRIQVCAEEGRDCSRQECSDTAVVNVTLTLPPKWGKLKIMSVC